jgi:hypothetical protein
MEPYPGGERPYALPYEEAAAWARFGIGNKVFPVTIRAQCRGPHLAIEARAPDLPRP